MSKKEKVKKRYYSIGEVAKQFGLSKSLVRYWETEFDFLKPYKNSKGERRFTEENLQQLQIIYNLVKVRGFTLEGAKHELKEQKTRLNKQQKSIEKLQSLRQFLFELKDKL